MGKRPPSAPAVALERLSVQAPHTTPSLLRCSASPGPLSRVPFRSLACHIDDDALAANDESYPLEMKQTAPRKPTIETPAGDILFGDTDGEERDPNDDCIRELLNGARCEA